MGGNNAGKGRSTASTTKRRGESCNGEACQRGENAVGLWDVKRKMETAGLMRRS